MKKPSRVRAHRAARLLEAGRLAEAARVIAGMAVLSGRAIDRGALCGSRLHTVIDSMLNARLACVETLNHEAIAETLEILNIWLTVTGWSISPEMDDAAAKVSSIPDFMQRVSPGTQPTDSPPLTLLLRLSGFD